jgi:hypothetical protein
MKAEGCDDWNFDLYAYKADGEVQGYPLRNWKSSRYMPHKASRITLEVVNVRVERVQDISDEDALAEGMSWEICKPYCFVDDPSFFEPIHTFWRYWDDLNGKRGFTFEANPWVWAIEFRRVF